MTEIIFRTLTPADVEKIYELETRSFKAAWSLNDFKECMASQKHLKVAAEIDKKILAYAVIEFSNDRNFYLMKFAVAPEFRRRGLGKIFLEFLLKLLLKWGGAVYLHVSTKNVAAIHLYETCGFKVIGRIENFYRNEGENAFTMERKF